MPLNQVVNLDRRLLEIARNIHAVQQAAYSIEAQLIGAKSFPPLKITPLDIQQSKIEYSGILVDDALIGSIGSESVGNRNRDITCLVVLPQWHRQGIATTLLADLLIRYPAATITVSTAAKNQPAISLYAKFGFIEIDRIVRQLESNGLPSVTAIEIVNFHKTTPEIQKKFC